MKASRCLVSRTDVFILNQNESIRSNGAPQTGLGRALSSLLSVDKHSLVPLSVGLGETGTAGSCEQISPPTREGNSLTGKSCGIRSEQARRKGTFTRRGLAAVLAKQARNTVSQMITDPWGKPTLVAGALSIRGPFRARGCLAHYARCS